MNVETVGLQWQCVQRGVVFIIGLIFFASYWQALAEEGKARYDNKVVFKAVDLVCWDFPAELSQGCQTPKYCRTDAQCQLL
jgi:hypothetical protein